ncbi:alpha/beta hydrolase [Alkalihalobacillus macyae]|uniref:alpha/beta hydrolase n=1 Tax=Guptibacillus hwajinpoensis TaxID=208199 RepID=UPI00273BAED9|nr:alpha/beta hydrolase [Alkalihalobacillus macyae]MDP4551412.1 alpha/beta hydrolase [Alkalihalobacillus macyae]
MKTMTYTQLLNETIAIYDKSGSLKAYQFMKENADGVEGNKAQLYNFKYALAAASGLEKEALATMKEAVVDHGYWYAYDYLQSDDDLNSLRNYDEFKELVALCRDREREAKEATSAELIIEGDGEHPVLMALHGDQENAEMTKTAWLSALKEGYTLALPQSSQIQFSDAYEWEDVEQGVAEVSEHVQHLSNSKNLVIGGFSAGCRVALKAILDKRFSVKGFVFAAPWLPEVEEWRNALDHLEGEGIRGYILCGDQDEDCLEGSQKLSELLKKKGIQHELKIIKNLDHEYPENFNEELASALTYINKEN